MKTKIKSPLLNSTNIRKQMSHRDDVEFLHTFRVIDDLSTAYDALSALHETHEPDLTTEGKAARYGEQYKKAMTALKTKVVGAAGQLDAMERRIRFAAEQKAGLHEPLSDYEASEIQRALRSMSEEDRSKALSDAVKRGDGLVLQAVRRARSPLLVGSHTTPIEQMIDAAIGAANPELERYMEDLNVVTNHLTMALDSFVKSADSMRDPIAEERANAKMQKANAATQKLNQAMQS